MKRNYTSHKLVSWKFLYTWLNRKQNKSAIYFQLLIHYNSLSKCSSTSFRWSFISPIVTENLILLTFFLFIELKKKKFKKINYIVTLSKNYIIVYILLLRKCRSLCNVLRSINTLFILYNGFCSKDLISTEK